MTDPLEVVLDVAASSDAVVLEIGALPFWAGVIAEYTKGDATEFERKGTPHAWRVFSFESRRRS